MNNVRAVPARSAKKKEDWKSLAFYYKEQTIELQDELRYYKNFFGHLEEILERIKS